MSSDSWDKKAGDLITGVLGKPVERLSGAVDETLTRAKEAAGLASKGPTLRGITVRHGVATSSGDGASIACELVSPTAIANDTAIWAYFGTPNGMLKGAGPTHVDDDGDLFVAATAALFEANRLARVALHVPYRAFREHPRDLQLRLAAGTHDGTTIAFHVETLLWPDDAERDLRSLSRALVVAALSTLARAHAIDDDTRAAIATGISATFAFDERARASLIEQIARTTPSEVAHVVHRFTLAATRDEQARAIDFILDVAVLDGGLADGARDFLRAVVAALSFSRHDLDRAIAARPSLDPTSHYRALELEPGAPWTDVKKAYVRLARDYHPDKVQALPQGFQDFATDRLRAINAAYAALKRTLHRG